MSDEIQLDRSKNVFGRTVIEADHENRWVSERKKKKEAKKGIEKEEAIICKS